MTKENWIEDYFISGCRRERFSFIRCYSCKEYIDWVHVTIQNKICGTRLVLCEDCFKKIFGNRFDEVILKLCEFKPTKEQAMKVFEDGGISKVEARIILKIIKNRYMYCSTKIRVLDRIKTKIFFGLEDK